MLFSRTRENLTGGIFYNSHISLASYFKVISYMVLLKVGTGTLTHPRAPTRPPINKEERQVYENIVVGDMEPKIF